MKLNLQALETRYDFFLYKFRNFVSSEANLSRSRKTLESSPLRWTECVLSRTRDALRELNNDDVNSDWLPDLFALKLTTTTDYIH
jgi:hypothetical protein